jgi:hypothetical protein
MGLLTCGLLHHMRGVGAVSIDFGYCRVASVGWSCRLTPVADAPGSCGLIACLATAGGGAVMAAY